MARYRDVPAILETFMEESGETRCWVTVNELRAYFDLDEFSSPAISGFLQRIYCGPFFRFPYRVERIEKVTLPKPHPRIVKKYLVTRRLQARKRDPEFREIPSVARGIQAGKRGLPGADAGTTGNNCRIISNPD
jgi:hypothetical protein